MGIKREAAHGNLLSLLTRTGQEINQILYIATEASNCARGTKKHSSLGEDGRPFGSPLPSPFSQAGSGSPSPRLHCHCEA